MIHAVIMVGGAGTRLWPVSRRSRPKQMMKVGSDVSLLDGTFARARALAGDNVIVVATAQLGDVVRQDLPDLRAEALVLEQRAATRPRASGSRRSTWRGATPTG